MCVGNFRKGGDVEEYGRVSHRSDFLQHNGAAGRINGATKRQTDTQRDSAAWVARKGRGERVGERQRDRETERQRDREIER